MSKFLLWCALMVLNSGAWADITTQTIEYRQGDTRLLGYLAYPKDGAAKHPGVLVMHEWQGLNDYARHRAEQLAELGYVALAADIYGDGKVATNPEEAAALSKRYKTDRTLLRARVSAALDTLKAWNGGVTNSLESLSPGQERPVRAYRTNRP